MPVFNNFSSISQRAIMFWLSGNVDEHLILWNYKWNGLNGNERYSWEDGLFMCTNIQTLDNSMLNVNLKIAKKIQNGKRIRGKIPLQSATVFGGVSANQWFGSIYTFKNFYINI